MAEVTDDDAAENIDRGDDQAGDRIAAYELRGTVHRTEERAFLLQLAAAALRFLFIDDAGGQIRIDRHLLAGNGIQCEARADFGDTGGTLGDNDEVDGDQDQKDDQTDHEVAGHDEAGEARNHAARRRRPLVAVRKDDTRRRNVQRQANHGRDQQHGWKRREIQRTLDPERHHEDEDRKCYGKGQPDIHQNDRNGQEQHAEDRYDAQCETDIPHARAYLGQGNDWWLRHKIVLSLHEKGDGKAAARFRGTGFLKSLTQFSPMLQPIPSR